MGLLDTIKGKYSSMDDYQKKNMMLGLAEGFAGMTSNPNAGQIIAGIQSQRQGLMDARKESLARDQAKASRNATAEYLRTQGHPALADAIISGAITGAQALSQINPNKPNSAIESYQFYVDQLKKSDPNTKPKSFEQWSIGLKQAGVAQPDAAIETGWKKKAGEAQVGIFTDNIQKGASASSTISNVAVLNQLGDAMDSGIIPPSLRSFVPEGLSGPIDAYKGILTSTALSLKGKGTGPMTDKDFDNLLATAGSISASPGARKLVQQVLADNARIALQVADLSSKAISGQLDRYEATKQINELMQSSPLTPEIQSRLNDLTSGDSKTNGKTIDEINAELKALKKLQSQMQQNKQG